MPIPNVSSLYQRLHSGSEGGLEFARCAKLLLSAHYDRLGKHFVAESDASGDYRKLDAYLRDISSVPELITGFQFKFFPAALKPSHRKELESGILQAITANPTMTEYILFTPEEFMKEGQEWWGQLKRKYEKKSTVTCNGVPVHFTRSLTHWSHTKIIELSLREEYIGHRYFPELFPGTVGSFKLDYAGIDCFNSNWTPSQKQKNAYFQIFGNKNQGLMSDPLFDFQFTNSTAEIFLLRAIEIHIERITHTIKGISAEYLLKSIGSIECMIDFDKENNVFDLKDPIKFKNYEPLRFNVQLKEFTKRAPGNGVTLKFLFDFGKYTILSESVYLNF